LKSTVLPQAEGKGSTQNVSFFWPLREATLSVLNVILFLLKTIFEKELIKTDFYLTESQA